MRRTYDVNSHDTAIEVDSQAFETNLRTQTLWSDAEGINRKQTRNGVCNQNASCWEVFFRNVIKQDLLEIFFGWLWSIFRDLLEC